MKYIDMLNQFWDLATLNPFPTGQVSLYLALLHINNRSYWEEWFQAPNQVLSILTGLSRSGILTARNGLKQAGLIEVRERGTKTALYRVIANSKQESVQADAQERKRNSVQNGVQNSVQNSGTYKDIRQKTEDTDHHISPLRRFGEFWDAYPRREEAAKHDTEIAYARAVVEGFEEKDLLTAAGNYAESCRIQETELRYIKMPDNFLRDRFFMRFLQGEYRAPVLQRKRQSATERYKAGLMSREIEDWEAFEKELTGFSDGRDQGKCECSAGGEERDGSNKKC